MNKVVGVFRFVAALCFALGCIVLVLLYLQWIKPEAKRTIIKSWARTFIRMIGMRLTIEGTVYEDSCLIVANHISFVDIFALNAMKPGRFIAKSEIADWPVFGRIAKGVDTLFIQRRNHRSIIAVNEQISAALMQKQTIMLFPEGKTSIGVSLLPLKANLIEPAVLSATPVLPVAICYTEKGQKTTKASYANISIFKCLWTICSTPDLAVTLKVLPVIDVRGKTRHEVAAEAAAVMSQAMGVPNPMIDQPEGLHHRCDAVGAEQKAA